MNARTATDFHITAKTPLRRLGKSVTWFEESAERATGSDDRRRFKRAAKAMREVVTAVFVHRFTAGEYDETA